LGGWVHDRRRSAAAAITSYTTVKARVHVMTTNRGRPRRWFRSTALTTRTLKSGPWSRGPPRSWSGKARSTTTDEVDIDF
jgi:hypothetical protein